MQAPETGAAGEEAGTKRFRAKRDAILAAAAQAINEQSARGMTFADVARRVGLNTTSVTYYFKRKEDLAAAAFEHTLDYLLLMLDAAAEAPTPAEREALARADVVVFASGSAVEAWMDAGLDAETSDPPLVVAIGPSTARTATERGLEPHAVASRPDPDGVVAAVVRAVRARAEPERPTP